MLSLIAFLQLLNSIFGLHRSNVEFLVNLTVGIVECQSRLPPQSKAPKTSPHAE